MIIAWDRPGAREDFGPGRRKSVGPAEVSTTNRYRAGPGTNTTPATAATETRYDRAAAVTLPQRPASAPPSTELDVFRRTFGHTPGSHPAG
ncbi:hypothetical protein [Streptomyces sp. NPDC001816]|uniref:hypothetical protein n=1 Tax=Streptomyces sp. NPDC001816 TaxID=3364612 RepID=UPI0036B99AC2